jgi:RNA polymerase sigma-54 factor
VPPYFPLPLDPAVRQRVLQMIVSESSAQPLSDKAIALALKQDGYQVARRTVAKYRLEMRIANSTRRQVVRLKKG